MSIAYTKKPEIVEKRSFIAGHHFKEVLKKTTKNIIDNSIDVLTVLVVLVTAIKELSGSEFSITWTIVLLGFLTFYFFKNYKCANPYENPDQPK